MSDSRRRRKSQQSGGSDDLSDSYDELNTTKETQSSEHTEDHHDSEYDTAGSESDADSQDRTQRESGDGQEEEKPQKKLDDDEDRRNPQYIPKRGTFYEHDDRTADEVNAEEVEKEPERDVKDKKVWKDEGDRWDHDRYNDEEQAPKSHAELIAVYGYDIRNEEGPPRARRRRRYGRGPNKYTRNWEDEDAYGKVSGNVPVHKVNKKPNRTDEEFPSLDPKDRDGMQKPVEEPVITSAWYSNKNKSKPQNFPPLQQTETQKLKPKKFTNSQLNDNKSSNERNNSSWKKEPKNVPFNQNANDVTTAGKETEKIVIVKTTLRENKRPPLVQESVSLAASKSRGRGFKANTNNNIVGSRTIESKPKGRGPGSIAFDNRKTNAEHEQIISDMKHMNVSTEGSSYHHAARQNKHFYTQSPSQQHSAAVPPRIHPSHPPQQQPPPPQQQQPPQQTPPQQQPPPQDMTTNRPKRYSSLRQRPPIAEGPPNPAQPNYQPPPPPPQHTYYPPPQAGNSRAVLESPGYAPGPYEQPAPVPAPTAPMGGQPVIPGIPPGAPPTTYAPHAPPPFLVPPPQFIPPQTAPPSITINYVPGPNGPIFQPNYQGYNPPGPPPPQDVSLYQPQGCTYYSPAQQPQQQQQPPAQLRRPKAIPILPPPDNLRGRDRNIQPGPEHQHQLQQEQLVQQQLQQQQEQLAQQQLQQQQQEQFVQQQLQQHQQQLIQEQQQELQQQELLKQQKQLKQQQEQLQLQQQKQLQQQQELIQQQLEQKQLEQEQQEQQHAHQQHKQEDQLVHEERDNQEDILVHEEQQKQKDEPVEDEQRKQENHLIQEKEQIQEELHEEQQSKKDQLQEKQQTYLQEEDEKSSHVTESIEKITIETASKGEQIFSDSLEKMTTEIKVDLQKELLSDNEKECPISVSEEISQSVVLTVEEESKAIQSKVVIPDVVPSVPDVEEKLEVVELKTEVQIANSLVEKSLVIDSEEVKDISIKTADLVSGKSETDCSIKESAVIEETAA